MADGARMPAAAGWLGWLGTIPFIATAATVQFAPQEFNAAAGEALIGYGAVILSFLGGIAWGRCLSDDVDGHPGRRTLMMSLSNVPPLLAWIALLLEPGHGLILLMVSFAAALAFDLKIVGLQVYPAWFRRLRVPLTLVVIAALGAARFG